MPIICIGAAWHPTCVIEYECKYLYLFEMKSPIEIFQHRFEEYVKTACGVTADKKVIVAVSGGVDSVLLLHLLITTRPDLTFTIAHVNHGLRGTEADEDELFVEKLAESKKIPYYAEKIDIPELNEKLKGSLQEIARNARLEYLENLREELGFDLIATGHHADDNAETVLFHLLRGSGIEGLSGIAPVRDRFIRPLLFASRDEIEHYAREEGIEYKTDSTNSKTEYTRNIIRNEFIPFIKEKLQGNISEVLNRTSILSRQIEEYFDTLCDENKDKFVKGTKREELIFLNEMFQTLPGALRNHLLRKVVREETGRLLTFGETEAVIRLHKSQPGRCFPLTNNFTFVREPDGVRLYKQRVVDQLLLNIQVGKEYESTEFTFKISDFPVEGVRLSTEESVEFVDADKTGSNFLLRNWKPGDAFIPLGMNGVKKLSDFLTDIKIPASEKNRVPVLESDGKIIWVCGYRIDDRVKITGETKRTIKLEYQRHR